MKFDLTNLLTFNTDITLMHKTIGDDYKEIWDVIPVKNCSWYTLKGTKSQAVGTSTINIKGKTQQIAVDIPKTDIPCSVDDYIFKGTVEINATPFELIKKYEGFQIKTISENDRLVIAKHLHIEGV